MPTNFQPQPQSKQSQRRHSRPRYYTLIALGLVFSLPVVLAWLTLQLGWFTAGVNNQGQWVTGQVAADTQWRLIVPQAANCVACSQAESLLAPVLLALGRDGQRVRLLLTPATSDLSTGFVYIADPPGSLVLRYPLSDSPSPEQLLQDQPPQAPIMAKALLKDLRRLLTYSRAG